MTIGQSAHYIQAWRIFSRKSASDLSILSYIMCFILILHAFTYAILIKKKLLMLAQGTGLVGSLTVIVGVLLYGKNKIINTTFELVIAYDILLT